MFLAFGWAQNDFRIRRMARYIREKLENLDIGLKYESTMHDDRLIDKSLATWRFVVISHSGIFLFSQFMAVGIDLLQSGTQFSPLRIGLLTVDIISIMMVGWITHQSSKTTNSKDNGESKNGT